KKKKKKKKKKKNCNTYEICFVSHNVGCCSIQTYTKLVIQICVTCKYDKQLDHHTNCMWFRQNQQRIRLLRKLFAPNERGEDETISYEQFLGLLKRYGVDTDSKSLESAHIEQFFRTMTTNCNIPGSHNEQNKQKEQELSVASSLSPDHSTNTFQEASKRKQSRLFPMLANDPINNLPKPKGKLDFRTFLYYFGAPFEDKHIEKTLKHVKSVDTLSNESKKNSLSYKIRASFDFSAPGAVGLHDHHHHHPPHNDSMLLTRSSVDLKGARGVHYLKTKRQSLPAQNALPMGPLSHMLEDASVDTDSAKNERDWLDVRSASQRFSATTSVTSLRAGIPTRETGSSPNCYIYIYMYTYIY
ncbi:hypothetical protein RFI_07718, partial [Reticulomyxa filosa]